MNDFTQAAAFLFAIDQIVMAITSAQVELSHAPLTRPGNSPRAQPEGRLVMMAMISVALFAVVLALPGLMTVLMSREIDSEQNAR